MGGYLCGNAVCLHCKKAHFREEGRCREDGCKCPKYFKSLHRSESC
ncbi:MAG: hypothetical protein OXP12_08610 [Thaumarchaeota archaeon]|nr:hypothetical protein [Nitrososphaerota archaeon]MDE0266583.1 hypothetical protein [Nitrososphaerota archaeon]MDE0526191.1 hypothetical protein [Nitrososphaerota archaeon]